MNKKLIQNQLEENIVRLTQNIETAPQQADTGQYDLLARSIQDLEELIEERAQGAIFRSKVRWINESRKPTKYFLNLEKNRSGAKNMPVLITEQQ